MYQFFHAFKLRQRYVFRALFTVVAIACLLILEAPDINVKGGVANIIKKHFTVSAESASLSENDGKIIYSNLSDNVEKLDLTDFPDNVKQEYKNIVQHVASVFKRSGAVFPETSEYVEHFYYVQFLPDTNQAKVVEIFGVINSENTHGLFVSIPLSAYLKDVNKFHVQLFDLNTAFYASVTNPEHIYKNVTVSRSELDPLGEPVNIIKLGSPSVVSPGPYVYFVSYTLTNIVEHLSDYDLLQFSLLGIQNTANYKTHKFYVMLPTGYLEYSLYKTQNTEEENSDTSNNINKIFKDLTSKVEKTEYDKYDILSYKDTGDNLQKYSLIIYAKYPHGFWHDSEKVKLAKTMERQLASKLKTYNRVKERFALLLSLAVIVPIFGVGYLWYKYGKEQFSKTVAPVFVPSKELEELSFASKYILYKYEKIRRPGRDVGADIIKLAQLGVLKIKKITSGRFFKKKSFALVATDKKVRIINQVQKFLLDKILEAIGDKEDKTIKIEELNITKADYEKYKSKAYEELNSIKGVYSEDSEKMRIKLIGISALFLIAGVLLWMFTPVLTVITKSILGVAIPVGYFVSLGFIVVIDAFVIVLATVYIKRLDSKGIKLYKELLGLKKYIAKAEIKRIKFLNDPDKLIEHFEKLLPYAIIFELEDKWLKIFKEAISKMNIEYAPSWYTDPSGGFISDVSAFSSDVKALSSSIATKVHTSTLSSSGSSTFAGGGVSFGGGGGGFSGGSGSGSW